MRRDGNPAERAVAWVGRSLGYLVASRRHEGGAGDQVWLARDWSGPVALIEVKGGRDPWENFRKPQRTAMRQAADRYGCEPLLAWVVKLGTVARPPEIVWLPAEDWPS